MADHGERNAVAAPFSSLAVRSSTEWVADHASHVSIDPAGIAKVVDGLHGDLPAVSWDFEGIHYFDGGPLTAQYLLVLDTLNFCFWPDGDLHYDHLAAGLKRALQRDNSIFDAKSLKSFTGIQLRELLEWPRPLPLQDERARLLAEVGTELERSFDGQAVNLILAARGSAVALVELVAMHFPGFRDHSVYKGHQVFLYKRAQIFVADLWGAFKGQGLGAFADIAAITMFADYIVPAVLRQWGILNYSPKLARIVDNLEELSSGTEEEIEIRACTIAAVEMLREKLRSKAGKEVLSVQVDWWLWSSGIGANKNLRFHRTRTLYY
ncbi:hypothetical protein SELMODRAFT_446845 [Selaginella moellendorffii]|uniref:Queuosine 5'-phosphate N-glycosylase/hydrolase n=1 Tax=Selaginella moellendorffii TaxID=88036 RepID=D8SUU1_SELML|nr:queuosine salvage protein isoform X2 [Selaginella moellendorffii]EFJ11753.1 hypothetical protein SELMODRAFT_446845 [Selaginella moellendorffii]|eukprot:XP_024516684.1 queuosine salvage protein isoform X2 [Selaginella moellendorffii]